MADVENQGGDSGAENEPNCPWWLKWGAKILGRFQKINFRLLTKLFGIEEMSSSPMSHAGMDRAHTHSFVGTIKRIFRTKKYRRN